MTDDKYDDADGWVVVHYPADSPEPHALGPYPPIDRDSMESFVRGQACECRRVLVPLGFPRGIKMLMAMDMAEAIEAGIMPPLPGQTSGPVH